MASRTESRTPSANGPWFVYMLECKGSRIYTGIALDVAARFTAHQQGKGAAFTRINPPTRILARMACETRSAALQTEAALKRLPRVRKLEWARRWAWPP